MALLKKGRPGLRKCALLGPLFQKKKKLKNGKKKEKKGMETAKGPELLRPVMKWPEPESGL